MIGIMTKRQAERLTTGSTIAMVVMTAAVVVSAVPARPRPPTSDQSQRALRPAPDLCAHGLNRLR